MSQYVHCTSFAIGEFLGASNEDWPDAGIRITFGVVSAMSRSLINL